MQLPVQNKKIDISQVVSTKQIGKKYFFPWMAMEVLFSLLL